WSLASGTETINGYTRSIVISDVFRDATGKIVTTGGTLDPSTKKIVVTLSWTKPYSDSASSTFYIARTSNALWTQTTQADFSLGTPSNTIITNTAGGEISLAKSGG